MKSMTGLDVNMSNSVELASVVPTTSRANSMTAHWRPRHRPRYGIAVLAREAGGEHLALDAAIAEPARDEDPGRAVELLVQVVVGQRLGVDPADLGSTLVRPRRVVERLGHRQVRVGQLDVLADEGDLEHRLGRLDALDQGAPAVEVGLASGSPRPSSRTRSSPRPASSNISGTS